LSSPTTEQRPARVERDGPLATIVIDSPPLNLFDEQLVTAIGEAVEQGPKATRFAQRLANGPTQAHAGTKAIVQAVREGGVHEADRRTPEITAPLVETDDFRNGLRSFLTEGPGKAKFKGR
jgi:enoyl-CoA hydratase